jgi:hypothetical protein
MNRKAFFGLLVVVMMLAVGTAGCTFSTNSSSGGASPSASTAPQNNTGYATYTNATAGVRIQYPPGWNVTEGGSNTTIVMFSTPVGGFNVNVLLGYHNVSSVKESLDEFKNATVSDLASITSPKYTNVSTGETTLAGMPAYTLTATATTQSGVVVKQMMVMTEKDYQVYTLTYTATQGLFPDYQNDFSNMTSSFAITS